MAAEPIPEAEVVQDVEVVHPDPLRSRWWLVRYIAGPQIRWCLLFAVYVVLQPPEKGLGIDLCPLHRMSQSPCPGCGMTRAGANFFRGNFRRALEFHPFAYVFMPVLMALVVLSLFPSAVRRTVAAGLSRRERALGLAYTTFLVSFFGFGLVRWVAVMAGWLAFPTNW